MVFRRSYGTRRARKTWRLVVKRSLPTPLGPLTLRLVFGRFITMLPTVTLPLAITRWQTTHWAAGTSHWVTAQDLTSPRAVTISKSRTLEWRGEATPTPQAGGGNKRGPFFPGEAEETLSAQPR